MPTRVRKLVNNARAGFDGQPGRIALRWQVVATQEHFGAVETDPRRHRKGRVIGGEHVVGRQPVPVRQAFAFDVETCERFAVRRIANLRRRLAQPLPPAASGKQTRVASLRFPERALLGRSPSACRCTRSRFDSQQLPAKGRELCRAACRPSPGSSAGVVVFVAFTLIEHLL